MINYTTEDLIKHLYQETSPAQARAIEKAIQENWGLRDEWNTLQESMQQLDGSVESPRHQSITAILNYAKSSSAVAQP